MAYYNDWRENKDQCATNRIVLVDVRSGTHCHRANFDCDLFSSLLDESVYGGFTFHSTDKAGIRMADSAPF